MLQSGKQSAASYTIASYLKEKYSISADYIASSLGDNFDIAVVAGSGFADYFGEYASLGELDYSEIPNLPQTSVLGHCGKLCKIEVAGKAVLLFSGRFHLYEGRTVEEICSISIISHLLGIPKMIFTNAAGGLNPNYKVGDAMLIRDTINLLYRDVSALFESRTAAISAREAFPKNIFSLNWIEKWVAKLVQSSIPFQEGVYLSTSGPSYETPAEIRFFRRLGATAAGMSTVLEAAAASRLGIDCVGLSLITNTLSEVNTSKLSHNDVIEASKDSANKIKKIIELAISD